MTNQYFIYQEVEDKSATKTAVYHVILLTSLTALFLFLVDGLQVITLRTPDIIVCYTHYLVL